MEWTPPPDGIAMCQGGGAFEPLKEEASTEEVSSIGIHLAKRSFQVHGVRDDGSVAFRRKLSGTKILDGEELPSGGLLLELRGPC